MSDTAVSIDYWLRVRGTSGPVSTGDALLLVDDDGDGDSAHALCDDLEYDDPVPRDSRVSDMPVFLVFVTVCGIMLVV